MTKPKPCREPGVDAPYTTVATRDAVLVNRVYFDAIDHAMEALPTPTIRDAIAVMHAQGSRPYFRHHWNGRAPSSLLYPHMEEAQFGSAVAPGHELIHLAGRVGHTPQQEMLGLPFNLGFHYGVGVRHFTPARVLYDLNETKAETKAFYIETGLRYQREAPEPLSQRDWAVYFAAGLYLRERVEQFKAADLLKAPYRVQQQFCATYADSDAPVISSTDERYNANDLLDAPYALATLSAKEWRAIEAVALGLVDPETERDPARNPYPQRMAGIKQALVVSGMFHDVRRGHADRVRDAAACATTGVAR